MLANILKALTEDSECRAVIHQQIERTRGYFPPRERRRYAVKSRKRGEKKTKVPKYSEENFQRSLSRLKLQVKIRKKAFALSSEDFGRLNLVLSYP